MLLLSLVLVHLIADFYMQTDKMIQYKKKYIYRHILHHLILLLVTFTIFSGYYHCFNNIFKHLILPIICITVSDYLIDIIKIYLIDLSNNKKNKINSENIIRLSIFIIDQILHIIIIIITCKLFYNIEINYMFRRVFELFQNTHGSSSLNTINILLFIIIIFIITTNVSGHIIKILLGSIPSQLATFEGKYSYKNEVKDDSPENTIFQKSITEELNYMIINKHDLSRGRLIGYIERLLVIVLTYYSAYPAIAFIVAAKSIARFKQLDDKDWAEYFLLGTLMSMLLGITSGIILRAILQ